jgi:hypothetical protein
MSDNNTRGAYRQKLQATMMAHWASHYRMPRSCIAAFFVLILSAGTTLAQFGGIQRPGRSGRNPNGQQSPTGSQNNNKVFGPTETLTGSLREISGTDLVIDAGDDRIILVQIQKGTKYLSTMDKVKASDFELGDHVTVEAIRDDTDHYFSKTITMNKKGTAEDKAAAMQASNPSSHSGSGGGSPDSDSDPDRPRLHRSNPDDNASNGQAASALSVDTPRNSASSDAPSSANTGSRTISGSGTDTGSVTVSRRPAVSSPPVSGPSVTDDSGPPVLRRSSAPTGSRPETQVASSGVPTADVPATSRPSLSAEDVNGVTRLPAIPPPSAAPDDARADREVRGSLAGTYRGGDPVIEQARDAAFSFTDTLPNYVVKQLTNRYATGSANRGRTSWQPLDIVTTDLVYEDGKERYTNVMVNGKPTKYIEQTGSWSEGEFASMLQAILAPDTKADFRNQKPVTIVNRPAYRYDYTVEQARSTWTLHADGHTFKPSYTGSIWVDKATYRVLRIEIAARNLPRDFPMDTAESSIDYDFVTISSQKLLLPSAADSLSCSRGTPDCTKNHTEFHNYKKYGADTNITFEGSPNQ